MMATLDFGGYSPEYAGLKSNLQAEQAECLGA